MREKPKGDKELEERWGGMKGDRGKQSGREEGLPCPSGPHTSLPTGNHCVPCPTQDVGTRSKALPPFCLQSPACPVLSGWFGSCHPLLRGL